MIAAALLSVAVLGPTGVGAQVLDLAVSGVTAPSSPAVGVAGNFVVTLGGTSGGTGVMVTAIFTPQVTFNTNGSSSGCYAYAAANDPATTVTCPATGLTGVTINVTPLTGGLLAMVAGVIGDQLDPNAANNSLTSAVVVPGTPPVVTGVSPSSGPTGGGQPVTISGNHLLNPTSVTFGGVNATVTGSTDTQISAVTPGHALGTVNVSVTTSGGTGTLAGGYTYVSGGPTITSVIPAYGTRLGGDSVDISGTNLSGATSATFGGVAATITMNTDTVVRVRTPAHTVGWVDVAVTTPGGTAVRLGGFDYLPPAPAVSSIGPNSGPTAGGTSITIAGKYFIPGARVFLGGAEATVTSVTYLQIKATTAARSWGTVNVDVTNPDGQDGTLYNGYTYIAPKPTISSINPTSGSAYGGQAVTVTGTNFMSGATLSLGGSAVTVTSHTATQLTGTTTSHAAGAVNVVVTNPDNQTATLSNGYTYFVPPPTVSSVSPTAGVSNKDTTITVTGSNFVSVPTLAVGGAAATAVSFQSSTQIRGTIHAHAAGVFDVVVTNPDGQSATLTNGFTYDPPPTVSSISPTTGSINGGTQVTITGTNFLAGATLKIGSAATNVTVVNSTTITATTAAHDAGPVDVKEKNPDGGDANTLHNAFTYQ